jgi:hypothetical protein
MRAVDEQQEEREVEDGGMHACFGESDEEIGSVPLLG